MARTELNESVLEPQGRLLVHIDGAAVTVNQRDAADPTPVYTGPTGPTEVTQPLITRFGRVESPDTPGGEIWLEPGSYDLHVELPPPDGRTWVQRFEAFSGRGDALGTLADVEGVFGPDDAPVFDGTAFKPRKVPNVDFAPINLRDEYGARGIGITGSDADTAAVLDAVAEATATGRPIYVPRGEDPASAYIIETALLIPDGAPLAAPGITFVGDGEDVSKLRFIYDGETDGVIRAANPAKFTDRATFRDLAIQGDPNNTARMPYGAFMRSCRRWRFEAVEFQFFGQHQVYYYGQRYLDGTIDSSTVAKSQLAVQLPASGAGSGTATLVDASQYQPSGFLFLDGELIRYTGKAGNDLTGLQRGVHGTTPAVHLAGAQAFSCPGDTTYNHFVLDSVCLGGTVAAMRLGGTPATVRTGGGCSNMNTISGGRSSTGADVGLWIEQGADNRVERHTVVDNVGTGFRDDWFRNVVDGLTCENNGGWGAHFRSDIFAECHHNQALLHDGGSNVLGLVNDPLYLNDIEVYRAGRQVARNVAPFSATARRNSWFNRPDGYLRWMSDDGDEHILAGATISYPGKATALGAGATQELDTFTLAAGQILVVRAAHGSNGAGTFTNRAIRIWNVTDNIEVYSYAGAMTVGAPVARFATLGGKRLRIELFNGTGAASDVHGNIAIEVI